MVDCPFLDRYTNASDPCQVSMQGVLRVVRENERLRDEADSLKEERAVDFEFDDVHGTTYAWDWHRDMKIDQLEEEVERWTKGLKLWGKSKAPNRECPKCGWVPVDSLVVECEVHKVPLRLVLRQSV